jgi:predicted Zn-dependent protease
MWNTSLAVALVLVSCLPIHASEARSGDMQPRLDLKALAEPLQDLTPADRALVDKAIKLIDMKQHLQALAYLTELTASNPKNSSLRVLRAYALLELGNITGALGDARTAESTGSHSGYRCWFLAQVAYLAGDKPLCRREIKHLSGNATYAAGVDQLRTDLKTSPK